MKKRKELIGIVLAVLVCAGASETFSYMKAEFYRGKRDICSAY